MKQQIILFAFLVILLAGMVAADDLSTTLCKAKCQAENLERAEWQRDAWCSTKCGATSAWDSVKGLFG